MQEKFTIKILERNRSCEGEKKTGKLLGVFFFPLSKARFLFHLLQQRFFSDCICFPISLWSRLRWRKISVPFISLSKIIVVVVYGKKKETKFESRMIRFIHVYFSFFNKKIENNSSKHYFWIDIALLERESFVSTSNSTPNPALKTSCFTFKFEEAKIHKSFLSLSGGKKSGERRKTFLFSRVAENTCFLHQTQLSIRFFFSHFLLYRHFKKCKQQFLFRY